MDSLKTILTFTPYYKTVVWGGDKIAALKGEKIDVERLGESWELSAVPGHESVVDEGPFAGKNIVELCHTYGSRLLGTKVAKEFGDDFPLLIKLIDARENLSVQVHPDDELARVRHNSRGKTEMWYVVDCEKDANIYSGLSASLDPESYVRRVGDNTIMDVVGAHKSAPGQFYFIPAGTIHAIGAGNLIAEIQETSDITYRVYDYDRRDAAGNPRQLHTVEARDAIDYTFPKEVEPTAKVFDATRMGAVECSYFTTDFIELKEGQKLDFITTGESFTVLMVVGGEVEVRVGKETRRLTCGHTTLIPAEAEDLTLTGCGKVLRVTV